MFRVTKPAPSVAITFGDVRQTMDGFGAADRNSVASTGACAVVAVNTNGAPASFYGGIGGLTVTSLVPWVTDATRDLAAQTAIAVSKSGTFSLALPASSVTTFAGTGA